MKREDREQPLRRGGSGGGDQERTWRDMGFTEAPQTAGETRGAQGGRETIDSKTTNRQESKAQVAGANKEAETTTQGPQTCNEGCNMGNRTGVRGMGNGGGTASRGDPTVDIQEEEWR